jgi:hypothetical protein
MFGSFSNGDQADCARRSSIIGKIFSGGAAIDAERRTMNVSGLDAA